MSALDKSLDDIISTSKKPFKGKKFVNKKISTNKVGKKVGASNKKPIVSFKKAAPAAKQEPSVDLSYATKVVVYGLPRDIKQDAIKDFFQSQVGAVQNLALSYNERGQFKGIATVIFKSPKSASLAVEKYNGAPIDGGSSKLKLELIVDPTKKPLTSRIAANSIATKKTAVKPAKGAKALAKGTAKVRPVAKKGQQAPKKKPAKKAKKTVEELDQEMADYFDN